MSAAASVLALLVVLSVPAFILAQESKPVLELGLHCFTAQVEVVDETARTATTYSLMYSHYSGYLRFETYSATAADAIVTVVDVASQNSFTWKRSAGSSGCVKQPLPDTPPLTDPPALTATDVLVYIAAGLAVNRKVMNGADNRAYTLINGNATSVRRMPVTTIEARKLGLRTGITVDAQWFFASPTWSLQGATSNTVQPVASTVRLASNIADAPALFNINFASYLQTSLPDSSIYEAFTAVGGCNVTDNALNSIAVNGTTTAAPLAGYKPIPNLPPQFSAVIQTTMLEKAISFAAYESFSGTLGLARYTLVLPTPNDVLGSRRVTSVVVNNAFQLTFQVSTDVSVSQPGSMWDPISSDGTQTTRRFFATSASSCTKNVFNERVVGDVSDLLLLTKANGPRYLGKASVRGISADVWEATMDTYRATWYFSERGTWTVSGLGGSNATGASPPPPLRIVIEGNGRSPFFVHHPFFQRGDIPQTKMTLACEGAALPPGDTHCDKGDNTFTHVHDILAFVPSVDDKEYTIPTSCQIDNGAQVNSYPTAANCPAGMTTASVFIVCLLCMLVSGVAVGLVVYQRMKRKLALVAAQELPPVPTS